MKLFDKVYVKSQKTLGYIVDIVENSYAVEKEGGYVPIFWNLLEDDLIPASQWQENNGNCVLNQRTEKGSRRPRKG